MIEKALEVEADAIGISGLLVKSTLIMRDNLEELNSRDLDLPVLLGGAALTRTYVERDLRNVYGGRLFYGRDAFEGLHVMDRLGEIKRDPSADDPEWGVVPSESEVKLAGRFGGRDAGADDADLPDRWVGLDAGNEVFVPPFTGSKVVKGIALDDITAYINETALFRNQWQFRPEAKADGTKETHEEFNERLRPMLRAQLAQATTEGLLNPAVVYGYYPANSDGQDIVIWSDESRDGEITRFRFPRSRVDPHQCISDLVKPVDSDELDYVAFHIVTMGAAVSERTAELFAADKYQDYLLLHGLGVEMAEALAELWHRRIREEWGFAEEDGPSLAGLFRQQYRGGRYSWGYPACPDLEDQVKLDELLQLEKIGVVLTEEFQLEPEQSTSAIIVPHPEAKYFIA
jgi:5-methyltetrahydrofolate--homocysteine methyltransferase